MKQLLYNLLISNIGWKALSLGLAVVLWVTLVGEQEFTTSVNAPIVLRNIPRDFEISSDVPERIHIEIQGPVGPVSHLSSPAVLLNLDNVSQAGERTYTIHQGNVSLPPGVSLVRAVPGQVRIRFERRIFRQVPVQVKISNNAPAGYHVTSKSVNPPTITVVGPESRVSRINSVETDSIDLSSQVGEVEYRVNTFSSDEHVRISGSQQVAVRIGVQKAAN